MDVLRYSDSLNFFVVTFITSVAVLLVVSNDDILIIIKSADMIVGTVIQ